MYHPNNKITILKKEKTHGIIILTRSLINIREGEEEINTKNFKERKNKTNFFKEETAKVLEEIRETG